MQNGFLMAGGHEIEVSHEGSVTVSGLMQVGSARRNEIDGLAGFVPENTKQCANRNHQKKVS